MKKIFTSILVAFTVVTFAQTSPVVSIPDDSFLQSLKDIGVDANKDGKIQESEAEAITELNISFKKVRNLTGIEAFINLTSLDCSSNPFKSLDVSKNTALTYLNSSYTGLTNLDVSKNTALTSLSCSYTTSLISLDVSKNTALTSLGCSYTGLTSLDVSKNTALTFLSCFYNNFKSLDVSKNTALTLLRCYSNQLISLDVTNNTALKELDCSKNQLTSLDVSNNIALKKLDCSSNINLKTICINQNQINPSWFWEKSDIAEFSTTCETITALEYANNSNPEILKAYNLQGLEVPTNTTGELIILLYDNGQTERVFNF